MDSILHPQITEEILSMVEQLGKQIYYLYEITGVKVGVTQRLSERQKEQKAKGQFIILDVYTDIFKVSDIERETQALKGYYVDKHPYWYTVLVQNKKSCTKEAIAKQVANNNPRKASIGSTRKLTEEQVIELRNWYRDNLYVTAADISKRYNISIASATFVLKGQTYSEIPGAVKIRKAKVICKYCGLQTSITNHKRFHGEKCKQK